MVSKELGHLKKFNSVMALSRLLIEIRELHSQ